MPRHSSNVKPKQQGQLRIIAGQWRGRKLSFPEVDGLRPTGDRLRETLFNWLQQDLHQAHCLDLFAGSGSLGLEALSRGASHCTFIDASKLVCQSLTENLTRLDCRSGQVVQQDAVFWLQQSASTLAQESERKPYDLIFCDPPFALDLWDEVIHAVNAHPLIAANARVYVETPKNQTVQIPDNWHLHRSKDAGQVSVCLYNRTV